MASGFKLADPREYRRGVILGLTLAEVLVLLVFLLLLSSSALLAHREDALRLAEVKLSRYETALASFVKHEKSVGSTLNTDELVSRLERANDYDRMEHDLNAAKSALAEVRKAAEKSAIELGELRSQMASISGDQKALAAKAAEGDAMAALLDRATPPGGSPAEKLRRVLEQFARQAMADENLAGQNAQMRAELARVKGNGGSGLPYCWTTPDGQPIYMLRIELRDDGVIAHELNPRPRPGDTAWALLDAVPREELMEITRLLDASAPLQTEATSQKCRYAVRVTDGTSRTNKPGYKSLMGKLWGRFMVREVGG